MTQAKTNSIQCKKISSTNQNSKMTQSSPTFQCKGGCKKQFPQEHHLLRHMKTNKTKCKICRKVFCNNSMRIEHEKSHETKQSKNCLVCALGFLTLQAKVLHLETHKEQKPFTCKICKREFDKKFPMVHHERSHLEHTLFQCGFCGIAYSSINKCEQHEVENHIVTKEEKKEKNLLKKTLLNNMVRERRAQGCKKTYTAECGLLLWVS